MLNIQHDTPDPLHLRYCQYAVLESSWNIDCRRRPVSRSTGGINSRKAPSIPDYLEYQVIQVLKTLKYLDYRLLKIPSVSELLEYLHLKAHVRGLCPITTTFEVFDLVHDRVFSHRRDAHCNPKPRGSGDGEARNGGQRNATKSFKSLVPPRSRLVCNARAVRRSEVMAYKSGMPE